jgi:hypothetical protein
MLFFPSLARGPGAFVPRRNEHTSAVETRGRGMEPAKFGQNEGGRIFYLTEPKKELEYAKL